MKSGEIYRENKMKQTIHIKLDRYQSQCLLDRIEHQLRHVKLFAEEEDETLCRSREEKEETCLDGDHGNSVVTRETPTVHMNEEQSPSRPPSSPSSYRLLAQYIYQLLFNQRSIYEMVVALEPFFSGGGQNGAKLMSTTDFLFWLVDEIVSLTTTTTTKSTSTRGSLVASNNERPVSTADDEIPTCSDDADQILPPSLQPVASNNDDDSLLQSNNQDTDTHASPAKRLKATTAAEESASDERQSMEPEVDQRVQVLNDTRLRDHFEQLHKSSPDQYPKYLSVYQFTQLAIKHRVDHVFWIIEREKDEWRTKMSQKSMEVATDKRKLDKRHYSHSVNRSLGSASNSSKACSFDNDQHRADDTRGRGSHKRRREP